MRFKARISQKNTLVLHSLVSSLERLGSRAAIHLCPENIKISIIFDSVDAPRCYTEIPVDVLFQEYRVECRSSHDSILLEVSLDLLGSALASGKSADICQLKLVKRRTPCLCFEAQSSQSVAAMDVVHDIPVNLLSPNDLVYFAPPEVPPPDTVLQLPRGKLFRTIVEKMTKFGKSVMITSSQQGHLTFRISQSSVTIKTFVGNLNPVFLEEQMDRATAGANTASVQVDIRKLSSILGLHHLPWDSATIFIAHNTSLFLELPLLSSGTIGFYIPIVVLNDSDEGES